jgi:GMP synthase (glutamine-hydrolysing)
MDAILILDFGSQYTQLIARRIRELNIYCEIHPWNKAPKTLPGLKGIILSGSPYSVRQTDSPQPSVNSFFGNVPILGICYGAQLMAHQLGGEVSASGTREYGRAHLKYINEANPLMRLLPEDSQVWMSHGDTITKLPAGAELICGTRDVANAGFCISEKKAWGIQFHPEVFHSTDGLQILSNFVVSICHCLQDWTPDSFVESTVQKLREKIGSDSVVMGLSGGVDSSVAAVLLHKAIGSRLHCIFIDNGLLRKNEFHDVLESYRNIGLRVAGVDASAEFYAALRGVSDPELKRKAIGKSFIEIFDREAHRITGIQWLGQGTIYPDVIESVSVSGGPSATIKSHHNVGGLPDVMKLQVVEPLRLLFKDEVRRVGASLHIPDNILNRHPFPGPGLGIRILGEITPAKVTLLQEADAIWIKGLKDEGLYHQVWQAGAILLPVQSVGVMGDERTYDQVVALRAVSSTDGMTADWCHLPYEFLARISNDIINKVKGINRVVYDISSKPPATIEWE